MPTRSRLTATRRQSPRRPLARSRHLSRPHFTPSSPFLPVLIILAIVIILFFYLFRRVFIVKSLTCQINPDQHPCPQSLLTNTYQLLGRPLFFYNFHQQLATLRTDSLPFTSVNYIKSLPHHLDVTFNFQDPVYRITLDDQQFFSFAADGSYTIIPTDSIPTIISHYPATHDQLTTYQLDPLLHQKLLELVTYGQPSSWQNVALFDFGRLEITTNQATYILDLFNLDSQLQILDYLETYHPNHAETDVIDLRLDTPAIRSSQL